MQPIERIGVFALLFLVVMVVAVWLFDRQPEGLATEVAAAGRNAAATSGAAKQTVHVPQLGQTIGKNRSKQKHSNSISSNQLSAGEAGKSDWKQRKQQHDARQKELAEATQASRDLPVSKPAKTLTPAPKSNSLTSSKSARHVPVNKPATRLSEQKTASRSKPASSKNKSQSAKDTVYKPSRQGPGGTTATADYVVAKGDTLSEISERWLGTATRWREIEELNGVKASSLKVGMKLRLPARNATAGSGSAAKATPVKSSQAKLRSSSKKYRVESGDSLWLIAQRQLGDGNRWSEIAKLNSKINPNRLVVGTSLVLPSGAAASKAKALTQVASATPTAKSSKPRVR